MLERLAQDRLLHPQARGDLRRAPGPSPDELADRAFQGRSLFVSKGTLGLVVQHAARREHQSGQRVRRASALVFAP